MLNRAKRSEASTHGILAGAWSNLVGAQRDRKGARNAERYLRSDVQQLQLPTIWPLQQAVLRRVSLTGSTSPHSRIKYSNRVASALLQRRGGTQP